MGVLKEKVAVITGGTRGLGLGIAKAFSQAGAKVVVASRSQKSIDESVELITQAGGEASGFSVDVSNLSQIEALAAYTVSHFGRLDIWVNNAGTAGPYGPTMGNSPQAVEQVVQTNILGMYYGSRTAMKIFLAQGSGKLINVLGRGDNTPVPWQNAYASSKAWARSFTKALARETRSSGVGVYAFNPGMVLTDLLTNVEVIEGSEDMLKQYPTVVRLLARSPEIPAQKAVWLASPATNGETGLWINMASPWELLSGGIKQAILNSQNGTKPNSDIHIKNIKYYQG
jgi:NAD(P)-dependent dehydrogenase (short-subunit alcohol dehydrogenase family)